MDIQINYLAVFLAAVSSMVVGSIWYLPAVFGKSWMKFTGVKMDRKDPPQQMAIMYGLTFVASLFTAFILAHIAFLANRFYQNNFLQDTTTAAIWLWLGFTAARFLVHDIFEGRRKKLTLINAGHELVTVLVMAVIIGAMGF